MLDIYLIEVVYKQIKTDRYEKNTFYYNDVRCDRTLGARV